MIDGMIGGDEWVIWNGSMGILDMVRIARIEEDENGRWGFLAAPYGAVGPFSLEALERQGRIAFGECLVMSRRRWQADQVELRIEARERRRAYYARFGFGVEGEGRGEEDDREERAILELPLEGALTAGEIRAAFRRLAKSAHPDAGGSAKRYLLVTEARDALLERSARADRRIADQRM